MYETAKETLMYRTVLWTLRERERVGRFGRMAHEEIPHVQGKSNPSKMVGVARGHQKAETLKP